MGLFNIFMSSRQRKRPPALEYSLASARQAIFQLASSADCEHICEEAKKHLRANLSDDKRDALKNRFSSLDQGTRAATEARLSRFDPTECEQDQKFLLWVLHETYCWKDNLVAIKHIADQVELKDIAINEVAPNPEKGMTALSRLIDQDLILEVVLKASDSCRDVLQEALRRLPNDQNLLLKIIKKAVSPFIRLMALEKIDDQKTLRIIAVKNSYWEVRLEAMKRTGDKVLFRRIARQDNEPSNRIFALSNMDGQKVISQVARYDKDKLVRLVAIDKLLNKSILNRIAKNEREDLEIRERAADLLSNEEIINKISALQKAIEDEEHVRHQKLKKELIEWVKDYLSNMSIVSGKWSVDNTLVKPGSLNDVINEMDNHGLLLVLNDDPRGTYRIMSNECENDCASYTINVRNYMSDNGYVYDYITRLIVRRIGDERFIWYQEEETIDLNL